MEVSATPLAAARPELVDIALREHRRLQVRPLCYHIGDHLARIGIGDGPE